MDGRFERTFTVGGSSLTAPRVMASRIAATRSDEIDSLLNRRDLLGLFIRNFRFEFLFERHNQLNRIQRVCAKIVYERSVIGNFVFFNTKLLGDDAFYLLFNTAHLFVFS